MKLETGKNRRTCPPNRETQKEFDALEVVPFPRTTHVIINMDMEDDEVREKVDKETRFWDFQTPVYNMLSYSKTKYSCKVRL